MVTMTRHVKSLSVLLYGRYIKHGQYPTVMKVVHLVGSRMVTVTRHVMSLCVLIYCRYI